jgi:hypothetical protein
VLLLIFARVDVLARARDHALSPRARRHVGLAHPEHSYAGRPPGLFELGTLRVLRLAAVVEAARRDRDELQSTLWLELAGSGGELSVCAGGGQNHKREGKEQGRSHRRFLLAERGAPDF